MPVFDWRKSCTLDLVMLRVRDSLLTILIAAASTGVAPAFPLDRAALVRHPDAKVPAADVDPADSKVSFRADDGQLIRGLGQRGQRKEEQQNNW